MIKLLIVDDFEADREEIASYIRQFSDALDIEIVGLCEDGVSAAEAIISLKPDIVLSDIKMPFMDGFALARFAEEYSSDISFIFMSLFSDVEHLKNAIDLECNGYIIKPIDPCELKCCLQRQIARCTKMQRLALEHSNLYQMVQNNASLITNIMVRDVLMGLPSAEGDSKDILKYFNINVSIENVWLCLIQIDDFELIRAKGIENRQLSELVFSLSDNHVSMEDFVARVFVGASGNHWNMVNEIGAALLIFIQLYLRDNNSSYEEMFGNKDGFIKLMQMETAEDAKRWFSATLSEIRENLLFRYRNKNKDTVQRIKSYIEQQPFKSFNLDNIAAHFFYSPNYLNSLFKRESNQTISEYLAGRRLSEAQHLLATTNKPVSAIAAQLGFTHVSYFNYVFKRNCGMTPMGFREGRVHHRG